MGRGAPPLLPPAAPGWPSPLPAGEPSPPPAGEAGRLDGPSMAEAAAALARIRVEALWWPAPRAGAPRPRALAFGAAGLAAARARFADADILRADAAAATDPERLEAAFGPPADVALWARIGGAAVLGAAGEALGEAPPPDPLALLAVARPRCPWSGREVALGAALDAQALLRAAALRARGPVALVGMSRWKRRCLAPFLTGPDGPPRAARSLAEAGDGPRALWGDAGEGDPAAAGALRVEDGFLRSVGLGLRHTAPVSLAIRPGPPHFDATRRNAFEQTVAAADFTPALKARAAALRAQVLAAGLTKYNLEGAAALPDAGGRLRVLAPGQVEDDASIRLGARAVRTNLALLEAARARFPDAFLLFKPHPDVETGLRPGAVPRAEALRFADAVADRAPAAACLDWADRVATITSLMGFEALLRRKAVTCFGRPFHAGWGLTDDVDPPPRDRALDLDELTAAALILHPDYIDPASGLPAPPEIAVAALLRARAAARRPLGRLDRAWRDALSWTLNRF